MIIRTVGISFIISFLPFFGLFFLPILFTGKELLNSFYSGCFILIFPLSFAYLILAKKLYDIDVVVRRLLILAVISIVPTVLLVAINGVMLTESPSIDSLFVELIGTFLILTLTLYGLENYMKKLEGVLFPRKHYLQHALKNIASKLGTIQNFQEMKDIFLSDILNTLEIRGCAIALYYTDGKSEIISEGEVEEERIHAEIITGGETDDYTSYIININENYTSYLMIGSKKNNTHLNKEEREWIEHIVSNLAVSLENIYLIQKLYIRLNELVAEIPAKDAADDVLWLRKALFEIQEKERFRIAIDLHDSTMQDMILLRRRIAAFAERNHFSPELEQELKQFMHHMDVMNVNLRHNCLDLNPHLELGFFQALRQWLNIEVNDFEIQLFTHEEEIIEGLEMDTKKHLFRIVQELVNNARKHSNASTVSLKLTVLDHNVCLTYRDNGRGFDMSKVSAAERMYSVTHSGGLGIIQLKSRVWLLKGTMRIFSKPGRGVKVSVRAPLTGQANVWIN